MKPVDQLFRYYVSVRFYDDGTANIHLNCDVFNVFQMTPCGAWIPKNGWEPFDKKTNGRWVSIGTRRAYAYPTREQALTSLVARNSWCQTHLMRRLNEAKFAGEFLKANLSEIKELIKSNSDIIALFHRKRNSFEQLGTPFDLVELKGIPR